MNPWVKTRWSGGGSGRTRGPGLKPNTLTWRSRETSHLGQCDNNGLRKRTKLQLALLRENLTVTIG
jgi:hypothetical protein